MPLRNVLALCCVSIVFATAAAGAAATTSGSTSSATAKTQCVAAQRSLAASSRANAPRVFDDYILDTRGPAICGQNTVTNDNEGTITIGLHIHNRSGFATNEAYGAFFDTDLNATTGGGGADYRVRLTGDSTVFGKWDGARFAPISTLEPAQWKPGYGPVFQVKASDLGSPQTFGISFFATDGTNADVAPNSGNWSYQMAPLELTIRAFRSDRAKAGRPFGASMLVVRSDLNTALVEGTIACIARIGSKTLAGTGTFASGGTNCSWRLPKGTRGKTLSGTIAVTFQDVEAKRSFVQRLR
jgi:hypothetical protein